MKYLIISLYLLSAAVSYGQEEWNNTLPPPAEKPLSPAPKQAEKIYSTIDEPARFPGDTAALKAFIKENLVYPAVALENGFTGKCIVRIVIGKEGTVSLYRFLDDIANCSECTKETLRIISIMPEWIPAKSEGKAVASLYDLFIPFTPGEEPAMKASPAPEKKPEVFQYVDEPAEFPGGMAALQKYIAENLRYPQTALDKGKQGKCYIQLIINETGKVTDVKVIRGVPDCPECDTEAVRLVSNMPNWTPGKLEGKPVASVFHLPIRFHPGNH